MESREIIALLGKYIADEVATARPETVPGVDVHLIEAGLVDSLGLFKVIAFIEDRLGAKIDPEDIVLENFATLGAIATLVHRKQGRAAA
jgi:acyl carrier protein